MLTISVRMDVWHQCKVGTVTSFEEDCHESNKSNHLRQIMRVHFADNDAHNASHDSNEADPDFLSPQTLAGGFIKKISNEATKGARDDVQKSKHGSPTTGLCLT